MRQHEVSALTVHKLYQQILWNVREAAEASNTEQSTQPKLS